MIFRQGEITFEVFENDFMVVTFNWVDEEILTLFYKGGK